MGRRERSTKSRLLREMDWLLIALVVIIVLYGVIAILSATSPGYDRESMTLGSFIASIDWKYAGMQLAFFAIGAVLCVLLVRIDYNNLRDFTNILYWIMVAVLVGVLFMPEVRGVSGWISITSSISIQPAEFCKLILIVVLAKEFAQRTENQDTGIS
ncbi:MAG: FtsW/RodA/SpoVE family cell cycle protein, partial [Christensenellaceae bacterium]